MSHAKSLMLYELSLSRYTGLSMALGVKQISRRFKGPSRSLQAEKTKKARGGKTESTYKTMGRPYTAK